MQYGSVVGKENIAAQVEDLVTFKGKITNIFHSFFEPQITMFAWWFVKIAKIGTWVLFCSVFCGV